MAGTRERAAAATLLCRGWILCDDHKARFIAPEIPAVANRDHGGRPTAAEHRPHQGSMAHMTRTGISPRWAASAEQFVEIHPDDAVRFGSSDDSLRGVVTDYGQCTHKVP